MYYDTHAHTHTHTHTHTHAKQVPLLVVWCIPSGGGPLVPTPMEHSYCSLVEQLEVIILTEGVEQTTSVYQSSRSTLTTPLGYRLDEHIYMELSIRLEVPGPETLDLSLLVITMSHVQCAIHQHEQLL